MVLSVVVQVADSATGTLANTAVITPSNGKPVTVDTSGPVITDQSLPTDPAMPVRDGDAGLPGQRGPLPTPGRALPLAPASALGLGALVPAAFPPIGRSMGRETGGY